MVTTAHRLTLGPEGQLTIPEDVQLEAGVKPGDSVVLFVDETHTIRVRRGLMTVQEMAGIFPTPPGLQVDDDFGNIIREANDEWVAKRMARLIDQDDEG